MLAYGILSAFYEAAKNFKTSPEWKDTIENAYLHNKWFVPENTHQSLECWVAQLETEQAKSWVQRYENWPEGFHGKKLGIIMAGNIPLVGMHDLISGLAAGCTVLVKTSSEDDVLPKFWVSQAAAHFPEIQERVQFVERLNDAELAIATGSNNSARYFEYYFRNIPHILRKNRNSVAVLTGAETAPDLLALGHDIFDYYGLGCRNVTHLLLPQGFKLEPMFVAWEAFYECINHNKYANNYNYHKALLLMNLDKHLDTGFLLVKENSDLYSPVGMLGYSYYNTMEEVQDWLHLRADQIQCVVSDSQNLQAVKLGASQTTNLWDYADGLDTIDWLLKNI